MSPVKIKRLDGWHSEFSIEGKLLRHHSTSWRGILLEYWPIEWTTCSIHQRQSTLTLSRAIVLSILLFSVFVFIMSIAAFVDSSPWPLWKAPAYNLISIAFLAAACGITSWGVVHFAFRWLGGYKTCAVVIQPPFSNMFGYELPAPKSEEDPVHLLAEQIEWHRSQPSDLTYNTAIQPFQFYQHGLLVILNHELAKNFLISILLVIITAVLSNLDRPTAREMGLLVLNRYQFFIYPIVAVLPFLPQAGRIAMWYSKRTKIPPPLRQADKLLRNAEAIAAKTILDGFEGRDSNIDALWMSIHAAVMTADMPNAIKLCANLQSLSDDDGERSLEFVQQYRALFARREVG